MTGQTAPNPLKIAVLIVSHNRRELTVRAVRSVEPIPALSTKVVLFDDASSDGTVGAVLSERPDTVVVKGDGGAFWNGGLFRAWTKALDLNVDGFLWLNDDVDLDTDTLHRLVSAWQDLSSEGAREFILVGATRGQNGELTYGGMKAVRSPLSLKLEMQPIMDERQTVDTFNGNIVLIPRSVTDRIGINSPDYFHNLGDIDYGLRAAASGVPVYLLPGTMGICEANDAKKSRGYGSANLSVREQWRKVNTHHGLPYASWLRFTRRHSGVWWPLHFLLPYRHLFKFWRRGNDGASARTGGYA